ncbi:MULTISPECIES: helix-turn-helix domain-containing protein [Rhodococcus]|uniref:helix-turn-helix domain-containing protein n=1 Tax=Rhodococcus TaxID=1827 RepID=UPI00184200A0|nr:MULTISPECIES: helix-turn-helix domain-containing protein [Rhodococcus]MBA8963839.1 AraC-like DNA-binding protein [Rhodococcus opacus]MBP2207331.1 AraC-like DNA-binding protein [Rhodococcus opacus]MDI9938646.1 helix-turn-helix domain-containing protein [Rhodococcus sp. IEGM 1351]MDJ0418631.1 helix-turn-helix domain-containing protein [Rhodococcus opacus]
MAYVLGTLVAPGTGGIPVPYWSTSGLSVQDQARYWGDVVCEAFTPLSPRRGRVHIDHSATAEGIPGWVRSEPLASTNGAEIASCTQLLTHGAAEVRRAPQEVLFVNLQLSGTCFGEQDGRRCIVRPGSFAIFDTTRPYTLEFREPSNEPNWRVLSFRIPRDHWRSTVRVDDATSCAIDTNTGPGHVVGAMMSALWSEQSNIDDIALKTLERSFTDVLTAATSSRVGAFATSDDERRDAALRRIVRHYIRAAVPLGRVSAEGAAREAAISVRTLHRLFQAVGTTFSACVRDERLRGAMSDLEVAPDSVMLSEIATRWGFCDSSHLTRTFQRHLECTPTQYRETHRIAAVSAQIAAMPAEDSIGS